jgi:hypothetical protein
VGPSGLLATNEIGVGVDSSADDTASANAQPRLDGTVGEAINISFNKKVSLESLTVHNYEQDGIENVMLSFVSGTNPFMGQMGYSSDYTFNSNSMSFKRLDVRGDTPYVITFGMGTQDDLIIEAGTVLSLTANPATANGIRLAMLTANVIAVPGDYNNNGIVDAADYVLWRKNPGGFPADAYATWRSNFGQPPGSGAGANVAAAVPEPASAWLNLVTTVVTILIGRRATSHVRSTC